MENYTEIPQNWTVTSDSLSAWLAKEIKADQRILIKRIEIDDDVTFIELEKENIVDSSFISFAGGTSFETKYLYADQQSCMRGMLKVSIDDY